MANKSNLKKKLELPTEMDDLYVEDLSNELGSEKHLVEEYIGTCLPDGVPFSTSTVKQQDYQEDMFSLTEGDSGVSVISEKENLNVAMVDDVEIPIVAQHPDAIDVVAPVITQVLEAVAPSELDYSKVVSGRGAELRTLLQDSNFKLKLGVTNKMLEKYAVNVFLENDLNTSAFTPLFVSLLGNLIVGIGYAEKIDPMSEKQPENVQEKETVVVTEQKVTSEGEYSRLRATSKWMDFIDFSILFLRSSQWSFLLVLIGVAGQSFHIYHVISNLSDLGGIARVINGLLWAVFLSFGLVSFTLKIGQTPITEYARLKKYMITINWFIAFDIFSNLYYWSYKFLLMPAVLDRYMREFTDSNGKVYFDVDWSAVDWMTFDLSRVQWPQMIAALVFSFAAPFILKAFAGEVNLPSHLDKLFRSYKEEK